MGKGKVLKPVKKVVSEELWGISDVLNPNYYLM